MQTGLLWMFSRSLPGSQKLEILVSDEPAPLLYAHLSIIVSSVARLHTISTSMIRTVLLVLSTMLTFI